MNKLGETVQDQAHQFKVPLASGQRNQLLQFLELLQKWGRTLRLTADPSPAVLVERHLPDALVLTRMLSNLPVNPKTAIDVGSGAGLPALPLAILTPEIHYTLVESRSRRCSFLQTAVHKLGLDNCRVVNGRIEQVSLPQADLALSKATFPPPIWLETAARLVHEHGHIALLCTSKDEAPEQARAHKMLQRAGIECYSVGSDVPRVAALYQCFT